MLELIVSGSGEKVPNVVYREKLDGERLVAVKRFSKQSWAGAQQFVVLFFWGVFLLSFQPEAAGVGKLRHKRLANLIGCCAEGDERLIVSSSCQMTRCSGTFSISDSRMWINLLIICKGSALSLDMHGSIGISFESSVRLPFPFPDCCKRMWNSILIRSAKMHLIS